jgi:hypothetical protein
LDEVPVSKPAIKPDPVSDISKLIQPSAVFQWRTDRRLADIRVALLRMIDAVPPNCRRSIETAAEEVFESALQVLLPGDL